MTTTDKHDSDITTGILLLISTLIALIVANYPSTRDNYHALVHYSSGIDLFHHKIGIRFAINEVLMCLFFFNIGLELKYNLINGDLSNKKVASMPLIGAIGGMIMPAAIYIGFNLSADGQIRGWAVPTATDIAFALSFLSLVKHQVPKSLKAFLLALAIFDDLGAIIIIALFYSHKLNLIGLSISMIVCLYLYRLNQRQILSLPYYIIAGTVLWAGLFIAGIHTTIGGVVTAVFIPMSTTKNGRKTYGDNNNLHQLSQKITPFVNTMILPIFAFFNAGTNIMSSNSILHPIGLGIICGLVIGKPLGIGLFCYIGEKLGYSKRPEKTKWRHIIGISFLCGIGFTMSLFIGKLAFHKPNHSHYINILKKSVLIGSFSSSIIGLGYLSGLHNKREIRRTRVTMAQKKDR